MSTDSVFDGLCGNYNESDKPNPLNTYAKTKFAGESVTMSRNPSNLVIRGNIIGREDSGKIPLKLVDWIVHQLRQGKPINGFTDVIFNPLSVITMSRMIGILATSCRDGGVWHLGSNNPVSKYDFILKIAKQACFAKAEINPCSINQFQLKPPRPKNTALNISKAVDFGLAAVSIESEIDFLLRKECGK